MTTKELLEEWQELMQREQPLAVDDILDDMEEWDSLSQIALAAFFDRKLGKSVSIDDLADCESVRDLLDLAGKA